MRGQPKKGVVSLGVNSLARETGLAKQTVSERMRRGQTADQIRIYAATREGRPPQNVFSSPAAPPRLASESDPLKVNAILRAWLERVMGKFHRCERLWGADCEDRSSTL